MITRCARPGTVGASRFLPFLPKSQDREAQDREAQRAAAEAARAAAAAEAASQAAAAAEAATTQAAAAAQVPTEQPKSTWGDTMATVVGAAAPTILAGVVLYYLTRSPQ